MNNSLRGLLSDGILAKAHFCRLTFTLEKNGDGGIDAIAVIVNNNLVTDIDIVEELLTQNGFLDVTFVLVQAERSAHFDGAKIGTFGFGAREFFW